MITSIAIEDGLTSSELWATTWSAMAGGQLLIQVTDPATIALSKEPS